MLQPPAFSYDYVAFRPTADYDYAIDNFMVETFTAGVLGDYNNNGKVDAADYVLWRNGGPLSNEVDTPGTVNAADYTEWRARFGNPGSGAGLGGAACRNRRRPCCCLSSDCWPRQCEGDATRSRH